MSGRGLLVVMLLLFFAGCSSNTVKDRPSEIEKKTNQAEDEYTYENELEKEYQMPDTDMADELSQEEFDLKFAVKPTLFELIDNGTVEQFKNELPERDISGIRNKDGYDLISYIIRKDKKEYIDAIILKYDITLFGTDVYGKTPMDYAIEKEDKMIMGKLIENRCRISDKAMNDKLLKEILFLFIMEENIKRIKQMVNEYKFNINFIHMEMAPLDYAIKNKKWNAAKFLIDLGAKEGKYIKK